MGMRYSVTTREGGGGWERKNCKALAPSAVKEISRWQLFAQGCRDAGAAAGKGSVEGGVAEGAWQKVRCGVEGRAGVGRFGEGLVL